VNTYGTEDVQLYAYLTSEQPGGYDQLFAPATLLPPPLQRPQPGQTGPQNPFKWKDQKAFWCTVPFVIRFRNDKHSEGREQL
jgi:hypothetical protein